MELYFEFGGEVVVIKLQGKNITFANSQTNLQQFVPIESINLSIEGILKEHPDLKGLPDGEMKQEAIVRLKKLVGNMKNENEIKDYLVKEFEGVGYIFNGFRREGFRMVKVR